MTMTTTIRSTALAAVLALTIVASGCSSNLRTGALGGAATGALVGAITSGSARAAIMGAAIGGAAGAAIGGIMDAQAKDLQDDLPNATVERVGEGIRITFDSGILFDVSSSTLRSAAVENLRELTASLDKYEGTDVLVLGHTDSTGDEGMNQTLSERRAIAARDFLLGAGLESGRVVAQGRGELEPVDSNDTDVGRQANRRVEIAIFASDDMQSEMLRRHGGDWDARAPLR